MSDFAKYALNASEYENEDPALRRVYAVGAVLEIISQKASQSKRPANSPSEPQH